MMLTRLGLDVTELMWLMDFEDGVTTREIARKSGLSIRRIQLGISRAKLAEDRAHGRAVQAMHLAELEHAARYKPGAPRLEEFSPGPLYPGGPRCRHKVEPIKEGLPLYCSDCDTSGADHLPYFLPSDDDPKPDPTPAPDTKPDEPPARPEPPKPETRKERRARLRSYDPHACSKAGNGPNPESGGA